MLAEIMILGKSEISLTEAHTKTKKTRSLSSLNKKGFSESFFFNP
jgi:hypothetical protein